MDWPKRIGTDCSDQEWKGLARTGRREQEWQVASQKWPQISNSNALEGKRNGNQQERDER
jgi:hypothetical protein